MDRLTDENKPFISPLHLRRSKEGDTVGYHYCIMALPYLILSKSVGKTIDTDTEVTGSILPRGGNLFYCKRGFIGHSLSLYYLFIVLFIT